MCITCGEHVYYTPRITHVYATHVHVLYLYVYTFNTCVGLHLYYMFYTCNTFQLYTYKCSTHELHV